MANRLKIGITNTSYGVYGFEGAIEKIASQGYDCIDYQGFVDVESSFFKLPEDEFMAELLRQKALMYQVMDCILKEYSQTNEKYELKKIRKAY